MGKEEEEWEGKEKEAICTLIFEMREGCTIRHTWHPFVDIIIFKVDLYGCYPEEHADCTLHLPLCLGNKLYVWA